LPYWPSYRSEGLTMLVDACPHAAPDFDRPRHEFLAHVVKQRAS